MVPRWREQLITYRRLEDRGQVRGGRFISGFLGEQFALPIAIESLRAASKQPTTGEVVMISPADPLNLVGIVIPGERVPPTSLKNILLRDGVLVADESRSTSSATETTPDSIDKLAVLRSPQRQLDATSSS